MSGVDTVRGIGYQHAHAVLTALEVVRDPDLAALRVEGTEDVLDIEIYDPQGRMVLAKQVKIRDSKYTWGKEELLSVLRRWSDLNIYADSKFEFVTDGRLGPTGEDVQIALGKAGSGDLAPIANLLGTTTSDSACIALGRAEIRQETSGVENVLAEAEREVRAMLAGTFTRAELELEAQACTDRLFTLLSTRAADPDPDVRLVDRQEIASVLGGFDRVALTDQWPGTLRNEYVAAALELRPEAVESRLQPFEHTGVATPNDEDSEFEGSNSGTVAVLLSGREPRLIAGPTGAGKSTAVQFLLNQGARDGKVVLASHAETYATTRLPGLVANALSTVLQREFSSATGQQALNDSEVILVIDGASEVPIGVRESIREELAAPLAAGKGATIVLVGRDIANLRSVLPTSVIPASFSLVGFSHSERQTAASQFIQRSTGGIDESDGSSAHRLASQVERALGDAAGNPMLFSMALDLIDRGESFTDRASLYRSTISLLAARGGATDVDVATTVLGRVFADLLDDGKRYATRFEWARLVGDATKLLHKSGIKIAPSAVEEAADRTGLMVPIGFTQTRAPLHDSYADYLAGLAHSRNIAPLPILPMADDEQRLLFTAELGGVGHELAERTARFLPFAAVKMSKYDTRPLDADSPHEISALFDLLTCESEGRRVSLMRVKDRVIASLVDGEAAWTTTETGVDTTSPSAVLTPNQGPLVAAVRLWRMSLRGSAPAAQRWLAPSRTIDRASARDLMAEHASSVREHLHAFADSLVPKAAQQSLVSAIGPFGLTAFVGTPNGEIDGPGLPIRYRSTDDVRVEFEPEQDDWDDSLYGSSRVDFFLRNPPALAAYERVVKAINTLTKQNWL